MRRPMDFWKGMVRFILIFSSIFRLLRCARRWTLIRIYSESSSRKQSACTPSLVSIRTTSHPLLPLPLLLSPCIHIFALRIYLRLFFPYFHHAYILLTKVFSTSLILPSSRTTSHPASHSLPFPSLPSFALSSPH